MKKVLLLLLFIYPLKSNSQSLILPAGSIWKYYDQGDVTNSNWMDNNFDDSAWSSGNAELGYGDGDKATVGSFGGNGKKKHITTDLRKTNDLTEQSALESKVKADDETLAYLSKVQALQTPPPTSGVYINEVMASNSETASDLIGGNSDWIEILNNTSNSVDLNGYYFTDNSNEFNKFQITRSIIIPAFGREIIWASGEPQRGVNHLDFSLSSSGEFIALIQPDGTTIVDSLSFPKQRTDVSFGRETDGAATFRFFNPASFNAPNDASSAYLGILEPPNFSHQGGFYQNPFSLTLSSLESGTTIYYSTDGSIPSPSKLTPQTYSYKNNYPVEPNSSPRSSLTRSFQSYQYSSSLSITNPVNVSNYVSEISTTFNNPGYFPTTQTEKCRVVSAITHKAGYLPSDQQVMSYFFSSTESNPFDLPILSLSVQEGFLFDYNSGIMTPGGNFDFWRSTFPSAQATVYSWANYLLRGEDYEKKAYLSLMKSNTDSYGQNIGIRIHGGTSRALRQKSLRIISRNAYGNESFDYPLFDQLPHNSFKTFIIYTGSQDTRTYLKDMSIHKISSHLNFDIQEATPSLLFLNGEFWGLHALRERYDKHYFARRYMVDENNLDVTEVVNPNNEQMDEGDATHIKNLRTFLLDNNLSQALNYNYVKTQVDVENFADYYIANIFFGNLDWASGNNRGLWRERNNYDPNAPAKRDGRWRWYMYDIDSGMSLDFVNSNNLFGALDGNEHFEESLFIRKLLKNDDYEDYFVSRFSDLLNTSFKYSYIASQVNHFKQILESSIEMQQARWANNSPKSTWENNVSNVLSFALQRPTIQKRHLRSQFSLSGNYDFTADVSDETAGYVHVNSIDILPTTPGVNQTPYPWTGEYFDNIPLKIHARPNLGYKFKYWEYNGSTITDSVLTINTSSNVSYKAIFEEDLLSANPEPVAFNVDKCGYTFKFWDSEATEATFPANMAFVYMDQEDPTLTANIAGFTSGDYDNDSKTRINGLGENGVSFINTGSGREGYPETRVGGAILSIKTTNYNNLSLAFTAGTVTSNSREYNLRLQYRIGDKLGFSDFLDQNNQVVEYTRSTGNGHEKQFEVNLPATLMNKPYVQLFWRYYYTGTRNNQDNGARDEIRLDDIKIKAKLLIKLPVTTCKTYNKYEEITIESTIDPNTSLTFEAGRAILIKSGFSTSPQTIFTATVTGCPE